MERRCDEVTAHTHASVTNGRTEANGKPRILLIIPGPKYDIEHEFRVRLEMLSREFQGIAFTSGGRPGVHRLGRFILVVVGFRPGRRFLWSYARSLSLLAKRIKRRGREVDLVVSYDPLKSGALAVFIARLLGARLAVEVNGDFAEPVNYSEIRNPLLRRLKRLAYVTLEKAVLHRADGIKLLYPQQLRPLRIGLDNKVIRTFPAYIDLRPFRHLGDQKTVLLAGFPFYVKGVDILIQAFKAVAQEFADWRLIILGWFPDRALLDAHIDNHPQIELRNPVPHTQMPQIVGEAGIVVLPSRTETLGRILLEAMAAGKPRIGSKVGGIPLTIRDGVDGLLFESGNSRQLATLLRRLMGDSDLRRRLGEAAAERIEEFSLERYFAEMAAFYNAILKWEAGGENPARVQLLDR